MHRSAKAKEPMVAEVRTVQNLASLQFPIAYRLVSKQEHILKESIIKLLEDSARHFGIARENQVADRTVVARLAERRPEKAFRRDFKWFPRVPSACR